MDTYRYRECNRSRELIQESEGALTMTLPEVGAIQFLQSASPGDHSRKQVTAVSSDEEGGKAKGQRERIVPSPIQDQVTLSNEAQSVGNIKQATLKQQCISAVPFTI